MCKYPSTPLVLKRRDDMTVTGTVSIHRLVLHMLFHLIYDDGWCAGKSSILPERGILCLSPVRRKWGTTKNAGENHDDSASAALCQDHWPMSWYPMFFAHQFSWQECHSISSFLKWKATKNHDNARSAMDQHSKSKRQSGRRSSLRGQIVVEKRVKEFPILRDSLRPDPKYISNNELESRDKPLGWALLDFEQNTK